MRTQFKLLPIALTIAIVTTYFSERSRASLTGFAGEPAASPPATPVIPKKTLTIHGPFAVSASELLKKSDTLSESGESSAPNAAGPPGKGAGTGEPSGPQTPTPTTSFLDTAGLAG